MERKTKEGVAGDESGPLLDTRFALGRGKLCDSYLLLHLTPGDAAGEGRSAGLVKNLRSKKHSLEVR